jgi:hypothetical protein
VHLELAPVRLDEPAERLAVPAPRERQQIPGPLDVSHGGPFRWSLSIVPLDRVDTAAAGNRSAAVSRSPPNPSGEWCRHI